METIVNKEFQSEPCLIIQYTHNEALEQSSCSETCARMQTHTLCWCWEWGGCSQLFFPQSMTKRRQLMETIVDKDFQSVPCLTFQNTHNETLDQSRCSETCGGMQLDTISWCWEWGALANFLHLCIKSQLVEIIVDKEFQSEPCLTIQYTHNEALDQSSFSKFFSGMQSHTICWCCEVGSL